MTVQEIEFDSSTKILDVPDLGSVTLHCEYHERRISDLTVSVFGKEVLISRFASSYPGDAPLQRTDRRVPYIGYALGTTSWPFAVLTGLRDFVVLNFRDRQIEVFQFFRGENEDRGFWRIDMFPVKEGLVVLYESGVALIDHVGKVAWHEKILWSDIMVSRDEAELHFSGEGQDGDYDWSIRLRDGVATGKPPL